MKAKVSDALVFGMLLAAYAVVDAVWAVGEWVDHAKQCVRRGFRG